MAVKRRKNFLGFGGRKGPSNYLPATGGIAYHSGKQKPAGKAVAKADDGILDDIAKNLAGKSYGKLSTGQQATVRKLAAKMSNPKRKRNAELALPKNKWINAKIRVTKDGKVQAAVSQSVFGKAGVSGGFSLPNPKRKRAKAKRKTVKRRKR